MRWITLAHSRNEALETIVTSSLGIWFDQRKDTDDTESGSIKHSNSKLSTSISIHVDG